MTEIVNCSNTECPYYTDSTRVIYPEGNVGDAKLVIIGEAPGRVENEQGRPFVGESGQLLRQELMNHGFNMEDILMTNVVWCRPPANETPKQECMEACYAFYSQWWLEIEGKPRVFMYAGRTAMDFFIKALKPKRGKVYKVGNKILVPVFHPAFLLPGRSPYAIWDFKDDLKLIHGIVNRSDQLKVVYYTVTCVTEMNELLDDVKRAEVVAFDLETIGTDPYAEGAKILSVSLGLKFPGGTMKTWVLPILHPKAGHGMSFTTLLANLHVIFGSDAVKVGQNAKFDMRWLKSVGVEVTNFYFDTMIAQYLLNSKEFEPIGLKHLTWMYFPEFGGYDEGIDLSPDVIEELDFQQFLDYSASDAFMCLKIFMAQEELLDKENLDFVYENVLKEATNSMTDVEDNGFKIDYEYTKQYISVCKKREEILDKKIRQDPSLPLTEEERKEFNFGSNKQLGDLLFKKMGLPVLHRTEKGMPSVDATTLKEFYSRGATFLGDLLEKKKYSKIRSTYLENYLEAAASNPFHLVRTNYHLGTRGGRLSSSDPGMQNLPKETRNCFISRFENGLLVEGDFKQVEMRVCAIYSEDENMIRMLNEGVDIHKESIAKVKTLMTGQFWEAEQITAEERQRGKGINFGFIYGRQAPSIADEFGISHDEAETFRNGFFELFPKVLEFHEQCKQKFTETGYTYSLLGRRRFLGGYEDSKAFNRCVNFPIQSLASDICLHTLNNLWRAMKDEGYRSKIVATVHDSIVIDAHPDEIEQVILLMEEMPKRINLFDFNIPVSFPMDINIGERWGSLEAV